MFGFFSRGLGASARLSLGAGTILLLALLNVI
jgi:hypothetical protein